ncbi:MAG: DUF4412 domain-containing protein [Opitutaceae bacterium]|nr:DUF4412 domain-containing protein [Opitutaceae bacterium]
MHLSVTFLQRGLLMAAFALPAAVLHATDSFEGRVEMKLTSAERGDPHVINYALKEGKLRFDFPKDQPGREQGGGSGAMIVDFGKRETLILMEMPDRQGGAPRKMYMRRPLPQPGEVQPNRGGADEPVSSPVATGRTEVIAGYKAAEYTVTGKNGDIHELWLAKGLGNFMFPAAQNPMGHGRPANAPAWEKLVRNGGFFPLRVITRDTGGREKTRLEVTKIEKIALPDTLFTPEGYSEFQIPGLGGGLPGGLNPFKR